MSRRPHSWIVLLSAASGCAALIYEVVWFQILQLVIGSSALSLGVLLGTFMGGLAIGSLVLPRIVRSPAPLRVYAWLELTIAASAAALLAAVPWLDDIYALGGGHLAARLALAGACLLVPTAAMGATLPVLARSAGPTRAGAAWIGWFYTANLAGAVAGTLVSGFYLLRIHDIYVATGVAVALNVAVAGLATGLARREGSESEPVRGTVRDSAPREPAAETPARSGGVWLVLAAIGLSGLTALAAQVVWTRLLALAFGATVYTFSLILAAVLAGLSAGSGAASVLVRSSRVAPGLAFAWCQILLVIGVVWAAYFVAAVVPFWPADTTAGPWRIFQHDFLRAALVVGPGALLWGASLPLAIASIGGPGREPGRLTGAVYGANTCGAIVGALGAGAILLPMAGSHRTQQAIVALAGVSGLLALAAASTIDRARAPVNASPSSAPRGWIGAVEWIGIAGSVALAASSVVPVPDALIAYGRQTAQWAEAARVADAGKVLYAGEGRHDFIAVSEDARGARYYHAAGKVQASTVPEDMRLQLLLAHISHLAPARPARVLVIGCGAGITAGALSIGPGVEALTIAEIEPLAPMAAAAYFGEHNHHVIRNPRVAVRVDDGRHLLATTDETFDVITTDLIDPWVKGVASLFTREFFELAKRRLRPGGAVTQFVQLYQSSPDAVRTEIATFLEAFPHAVVWGNPHEGQGYDLVLLGQLEPIRIDLDEWQRRLDHPDAAAVRASLARIGVTGAVDLAATYAASRDDLLPWLRGATINRDRHLRLQYLAGLGLNVDANAAIYREMLGYARFPDGFVRGSDASMAAFRDALARRRN